MLILSDQMPQSGVTGTWVKVEYHTNLTIPFLLYFDTGKPLYFNCFKNAVNHTHYLPARYDPFWQRKQVSYQCSDWLILTYNLRDQS